MIFWLDILVSKKLVSCWCKNTFGHSCGTTLRRTLKVVRYVWHQKRIRHKPYRDLQSLPVPTHWGKDLSMDFVTGLPISTNWKGDSYDSLLVIVDQLTKIVHYKQVKITIDASGLAKVIIDVVVCHHGFSDLIVTDKGSLFTSKFWLLLWYFFGI